MNLLGASIQLWGEPQLVRYISRNSFKPTPGVDSAIIKITPKTPLPPDQKDLYYEALHVLFAKPRKTILNNLKSAGFSKEDLEKMGFDSRLRPQNLSVEDIVRLSHLFTTQGSSKKTII